jgi:hypothetical protein
MRSGRNCRMTLIAAVVGCLRSYSRFGLSAPVMHAPKLSTFTGRRRVMMLQPLLLSNRSCLCSITHDA